MTVEDFQRLLEGKKPKVVKPKKEQPAPRNFRDVLPENQTFCFTGTLSTPRSQLEEEVYDIGGEVRNNISKNVTYLVAENINGRSSKLREARALGIPIITEEEFWNIMSN